MYKKSFINILIFTLFIVLIFTQIVSATIRVEPSRFIFTIDPGQRTTDVIQVINNTDETVELTAVYYDWNLNQEDEMLNYESGTLLESFDGLIRFNPRSLKLGPGEDQLVRFTISIPEEASGEHERRGIIFFEHEDEFLNEGVGASIRTMIGTVVYVAPIGYNYTFSILDNIVLQSPDNQFLVGILAKNEGLKHARINVEYKLVSGEGRVLLEDRTEERVILPGEDRGIFFPLIYDFVSGEYEILYTVTFSDSRETLTNSIKFYVD